MTDVRGAMAEDILEGDCVTAGNGAKRRPIDVEDDISAHEGQASDCGAARCDAPDYVRATLPDDRRPG